jgi:hypothetical protein
MNFLSRYRCFGVFIGWFEGGTESPPLAREIDGVKKNLPMG